MKGLISGVVRERKMVLFIGLIIMVFGVFNYCIMPKQENPQIKITAAIVTTLYPGASPEDVEQLVTDKIEDAVSEAVDSPLFLDFAKNFTTMPIKMRHEEYTKLLEDGWPKQVMIFQKLGRIKEPATAPR